MPALVLALVRPLRDRNVIILSLLVTSCYLLIQIYALNNQLIFQTATGVFPLSYKVTLLASLIYGYFLMFPLSQTLFTITTALLVGINLTLILSLTQKTRQAGNMKVSVGGTGVLALASTGCPSCGITILSFLGPSSSFFVILLHSVVAQGIIVGVLMLSIIYSLKKLDQSLVCQITPSKK